MDRARLFFGLRLATSVICGLVLVLVVGFWVRSFSWSDVLSLPVPPNRTLFISSVHGVVSFEVIHWNDGSPTGTASLDSEEITADTPELLAPRPWFEWEVSRGADGGSELASLPYWLVALVLAAVAALPWVARRFSLRTLLIAMMVVAVLLGTGSVLLRR